MKKESESMLRSLLEVYADEDESFVDENGELDFFYYFECMGHTIQCFIDLLIEKNKELSALA